jgi:hypothetical protein
MKVVDEEVVLAQLAAAFGYVRRDEGCTLHQAQLIDQSLIRDIREGVRRRKAAGPLH